MAWKDSSAYGKKNGLRLGASLTQRVSSIEAAEWVIAPAGHWAMHDLQEIHSDNAITVDFFP